MAMTNVCQRSICIHQNCRNKGFMFTIKEVWDQVCSPENQFFNISSCKWPSTASLKSFTWFWRGIDVLLPIYFFHRTSVSSTWRHKFYWFWLISTAFSGTFWSETTHLQTLIASNQKRYQETVNGDLPDFCCSFKFGNKKTFHLHFKRFFASALPLCNLFTRRRASKDY